CPLVRVVSARITTLCDDSCEAVTLPKLTLSKLFKPSARRISPRYGPNLFVAAVFVTNRIGGVPPDWAAAGATLPHARKLKAIKIQSSKVRECRFIANCFYSPDGY